MALDATAQDPAPEDHAPTEAAPAGPGRITRVILKNYKSIVSCDVELQPLTILVGPNGSGKSNFLDALAFVSEALTVGLDQAIRNRGNIDRILSASRAPGDDSFSIELFFQLTLELRGSYLITIELTPTSEVGVRDEKLSLIGAEFPDGPPLWRESDGRPSLMLAHFAGSPQMQQTHGLLTTMVFYNPLPDLMRAPVEQSAEPHLLPDGRNVASILRRMQTGASDQIWGITQYMKRVLPGLEEINSTEFQGFDYLSFSVGSGEKDSALEFVASQMSDGTLRALAILVALFQGRMGGKSATSLVGIEEPENNLHPATGGAFANALLDAAYTTQVLVTTHSMSLLYGDEIDVSSLLAVVAENGKTQIGPIDKVGRSILQDHLLTAGEMLQQNQLLPEPKPEAAPPGPAVSDPTPVIA